MQAKCTENKKTACQNVVPEIYGSCLSEQSKKGKGSPYSLPTVGPGADPGVQACSQPAGDYKSSTRR